MKLIATATVLTAAISALLLAPQPRHGATRLPELLGATVRLVAVAVVPRNEASLIDAVQDFVAAQMNGRHTIVTRPALTGSQPGVQSHRLR